MSLWNQGGGGPKKFGNRWFKLFLRTKRTAGIGKQCPINCGYSYANGTVVLAEGLDIFRVWALTIAARMIPSSNLLKLSLDGCLVVERRTVESSG
jgi:hypothetical protein